VQGWAEDLLGLVGAMCCMANHPAAYLEYVERLLFGKYSGMLPRLQGLVAQLTAPEEYEAMSTGERIANPSTVLLHK
jgi:hypothetical protein